MKAGSKVLAAPSVIKTLEDLRHHLKFAGKEGGGFYVFASRFGLIEVTGEEYERLENVLRRTGQFNEREVEL